MIIIFSDTDDENIAKYSKSRQSYWLHPSTHWTRHPILRQICIFPIRWLGKNHLFETEEMMQKPAPCDAMLLHNYSQIKSSKKTHIYIYNIYMFWEAQPVKCPSIFAGRVTELSGWLFRFSVSSLEHSTKHKGKNSECTCTTIVRQFEWWVLLCLLGVSAWKFL